jgi:hypothetical protein
MPCENEFFDPLDLVQVKYEMLRRVRADHKSIRRAAQDFGFSRPSVYRARAAFERAGLPGLLPAERGPRAAASNSSSQSDCMSAGVRVSRMRGLCDGHTRESNIPEYCLNCRPAHHGQSKSIVQLS